MAVKGVRFGVTGQTIQVGSMTGAVTSDAAVAVSGIIEIVDTSGSGACAIFVPPFGTTRPFLVPDGMTHLHATNKVNVRSLNNA